jgi:hypothetical protein
LPEAPDYDTSVAVSGVPAGSAAAFVEREYIPLVSGDYCVNYATGAVQFHEDDVGVGVAFEYSGLGSIIMAAHTNQYRDHILNGNGAGIPVYAVGDVDAYQCVTATHASEGYIGVVATDTSTVSGARSIGLAVADIDDGTTGHVMASGIVSGVPGCGPVGSRLVTGDDGFLAWVDDATGNVSGNYPTAGAYARNMGEVIGVGVVLLAIEKTRPIEVAG